jgi:hypothetical protein
MRAAAVKYVTNIPTRRGVPGSAASARRGNSGLYAGILMRTSPPRYGADCNANPEFIGPRRFGEEIRIFSAPRTPKLELKLISVAKNLCEKGRGKNKIKCAFYAICGVQRQRHTTANIWFAAHECLGHEMPKAFGKVGLMLIDESPFGAVVLGTDKPFTVELKELRSTSKIDFAGREA